MSVHQPTPEEWQKAHAAAISAARRATLLGITLFTARRQGKPFLEQLIRDDMTEFIEDGADPSEVLMSVGMALAEAYDVIGELTATVEEATGHNFDETWAQNVAQAQAARPDLFFNVQNPKK